MPKKLSAKAPVKKKKHKLKKLEPMAHIEGDFIILGCDLSMSSPGFALVQYREADRSIEIIRVECVRNKKYMGIKTHGKILAEIADMFADLIANKNVKVVIRERGISRFAQATETLHQVVGVSTMILWQIKECSFQELTPSAIKKYVTGSGKAEKEDVAEAIDNYCPDHRAFYTDDESDACAAAIAWLIENGYLDAKPLKKFMGE